LFFGRRGAPGPPDLVTGVVVARKGRPYSTTTAASPARPAASPMHRSQIGRSDGREILTGLGSRAVSPVGDDALQTEAHEAARQQRRRQRRKDICFYCTAAAVYAGIVFLICWVIESPVPFVMQLAVIACCVCCKKWQKMIRRPDRENLGAQTLLDSKPASRRGFVTSDMPGMENQLVDLDEVVEGTDLCDMVLVRATGSEQQTASVYQGVVVEVGTPGRGSESGVFYVENAPATPSTANNLFGDPNEDVRTG
jgi:hypothetical protein